ncbi:MAG: hypothetical protein WCW02_00240 [Candidatus Buchananbacteria bacterium]
MDGNSQVPTWRINLSFWYLNHRAGLKKILVYFLIGLDSCILVALAILLVVLAISERNYLEQMSLLRYNLVNYQAYHVAHQPKVLQWGAVQVLGGKNSKYDLVAEVYNPNEEWEAYVTYQFLSGGNLLTKKTAFVLPQERKSIFSLGEKITNAPEVSFQMIKVEWHRRAQAKVWQDERLRFTITDLTVNRENYGSDLVLTGVKFKVTNNSIFNFWQVGFIVKYGTGGSLSAINYVATQELASGQTKEIQTSWLGSLPAGLAAEVTAEVDIFDESVYYQTLEPAGELK